MIFGNNGIHVKNNHLNLLILLSHHKNPLRDVIYIIISYLKGIFFHLSTGPFFHRLTLGVSVDLFIVVTFNAILIFVSKSFSFYRC